MTGGRVALGDRHEARQPSLRSKKVVTAGIERALGRQIPNRQQKAVRVDEKAEFHRHRHRPRGIFKRLKSRYKRSGQRRAAITPMTLNAGAYGVRPELQIRTSVVVFFKNNFANRVPQDRSLFREFFNTLFNRVAERGRFKQTVRETFDLLAQPPPRYGLRFAQIAQSTCLFPDQI